MSRAKKPDRISWSNRLGRAFGASLELSRGGALNGWIETPNGIVGVASGRDFLIAGVKTPRVTRLYFAHAERLHVWSYSRYLTRRGLEIEAHKMTRELAR